MEEAALPVAEYRGGSVSSTQREVERMDLVSQSASQVTILREFDGLPSNEKVSVVSEMLSNLSVSQLGSVQSHLNTLLFRDFVAKLPLELALKILTSLSPKDISEASRVSRLWYDRCQSGDLWAHFWRRSDFGILLMRYPFAGDDRSRYLQYYQKKILLERGWRLGTPQKVEISTRSDGCYTFQFDADKIVAGLRDQTVKVYSNSPPYALRSEFKGHSGSVLSLQYDSEKMITGSSDATIRVWDIKTGACTHVLNDHSNAVLQVKFDRRHLFTSSKDFSIKIFRIIQPGDPDCISGQTEYALERTLLEHSAAVNSIDFDESLLVSASGDRTIRIWRREDGSCDHVLRDHQRGVACLQLFKKIIASGSSDSNIKIWDALSGRCMRTLQGHTDLVRCLRFNDQYLVSGSYDMLIIVWDWKTGERLYTLQGPRQRVFRVDFDLTQLISSSQDEKIVLWSFDAPTGGGSPVRLAAPSRPQVSRFHPPGYSDV
eukprot:m.254974 g.254974  ORF g.254974 m.254974 type:complete len:488 (+) comp54541_c0_seq2:137-1600(+)